MTTIGVSQKVRYSYTDHSAEVTSTSLHFAPVISDGSNAAVWAAVTGSALIMSGALATVTRLNPKQASVSFHLNSPDPSVPLEALAQREIAARMIYADTVTGKKYRFDIPAPNDDFIPTGSDDINMAAAVWVTFKGFFDAEVKSELGNPVELLSGRIVGRNN